MTQNILTLTRRGPLNKVWIAATFEKGLNRAAILNTDIAKIVNIILTGIPTAEDSNQYEQLNIKLSSLLYYGLVRIYSKKTKLLYEEIRDFQMRVTMSFHTSNIDLPSESGSSKTHNMLPAVGVPDALFPMNIEPFLRPSLFGDLAQQRDLDNADILRAEGSYFGRTTPQVYQSAALNLPEEIPTLDSTLANIRTFDILQDNLEVLDPMNVTDPDQLLRLGEAFSGLNELPTGLENQDGYLNIDENAGVYFDARDALQAAGALEREEGLDEEGDSSNRRKRLPEDLRTPPLTQAPEDRLFAFDFDMESKPGEGESRKGRRESGDQSRTRTKAKATPDETDRLRNFLANRNLQALIDDEITLSDNQIREQNSNANDITRHVTPQEQEEDFVKQEELFPVEQAVSERPSTTPLHDLFGSINTSGLGGNRATPRPQTALPFSRNTTPIDISASFLMSGPALLRQLLSRGLLPRFATPFVSDVGNNDDGHLDGPFGALRRGSAFGALNRTPAVEVAAASATPSSDSRRRAAHELTTPEAGASSTSTGLFNFETENPERSVAERYGAEGERKGAGDVPEDQLDMPNFDLPETNSPSLLPYPSSSAPYTTVLSPLLALNSPDYVSAPTHVPSMSTITSASSHTPKPENYDPKTLGLLNFTKKHFTKLSNETQEEEQEEKTTFTDLIASKRRRTAAYAFAGLLTLQNSGYIRLHQDIPYGPITITQTDHLRTYTIGSTPKRT